MNVVLRIGQVVEIWCVFVSMDGDDLICLFGVFVFLYVVLEVLINVMFFYFLGVDLFGQGINYLKQEIEFVSDVVYGELFLVCVEIICLCFDKYLVDLEIICCVEDGCLIVCGCVLVFVCDVVGVWD